MAQDQYQRADGAQLVTLVFTDIIGSTQLKQTLGDHDAQALLQRHHGLVRSLLSTFTGAREIETAGDSFFLVFSQPAEAVRFALQLQSRLRQLSRGDHPLRDRIGIHMGEVLAQPAQEPALPKALFGIQVDTCSRVMSLGSGDQILLTQAAWDNARRELDGATISGVQRIEWRSHGRYHLKGLVDPVEIYEVGESGGALFKEPEDSDKAVRHRPGVAPVFPEPGQATRLVLAMRRLRKRLAVGLGLPLLALLLAGAVFRHELPGWLDVLLRRQIQCVVVLPFAAAGSRPELRDFADGLADPVATRLTELEGSGNYLRVVPLAEVRREGALSLSEARRRFGATLVVSGAVTAEGDRMRLNVTLSDPRTLRQLQGDTIDLGTESLFNVQDRVAQLLAEWLKLTVSQTSRAGATQPRNRTAYALYLQALGALARFDRAENREAAIRWFRAALELDPHYAPAHAGLGEAYLRRYEKDKAGVGLLELARASCERALALDPRLAVARVAQGRLAGATGRYAEAIQHFQESLKLEPLNAEALRGLAGTFESDNKIDAAEATYRQSVERSPRYWGGYNELGAFYSRIGRYAEAEACFRKVVQLTPDNYAGYRNLGGVLYLRERLDDAVACFRQSLTLRPSAETLSNLGTVDFFRGRYADAAKDFEEALRLNPNDHVLWGNLGDACVWVPELRMRGTNAYRRALDLVTQELAVAPNDAERRASEALYLLGLGDTSRATAGIEDALARAPDNINYNFLAALVYEGADRRADALRQLERAARAGYSTVEIRRHPALANLRRDPRFQVVQGLLQSARKPVL